MAQEYEEVARLENLVGCEGFMRDRSKKEPCFQLGRTVVHDAIK